MWLALLVSEIDQYSKLHLSVTQDMNEKKASIHYREILSQDSLSRLTSPIMLKKLNQLPLFLDIVLPLNMMVQNLISSGSPLYKLPYKNTYIMETLVTESSFHTTKVEGTQSEAFTQTKKILPSPYRGGYNKEIEAY